MDLMFQVPMQYFLWQHWTLLPSPVTSTTGCCFCFGSVSSFFLELSLHWSPVAYWAPTTLGPLSFSVHFLPFPTVHGVPKARILKWFAIPFSRGPRFLRPLHHDPAVLGGPTEHDSEFHWLRQAVVHVIILVSVLWLWFQSVYPLMEKDKRFMEASWWERLTDTYFLFQTIISQLPIPSGLFAHSILPID